VNVLAMWIGYGVMAVAGIAAVALGAYFTVSAIFEVAVNRIGGVKVLRQYLIDQPNYKRFKAALAANKDQSP
jgi:hypothetical protein